MKKMIICLFVVFCISGQLHAENLLINPSFEAGTYGWTWNFLQSQNDQDADVQFTADRSTPTASSELGETSLRISPLAGHAQSLSCYQLCSTAIPIKEGKNYTVSFYARTLEGNGCGCWIRIATPPAAGERPIVFIERQEFKITGAEWKKFQFSFTAAKPVNPGPWDRHTADQIRFSAAVYQIAEGSSVWFDGFQLAETKDAPYDDGLPFFGAAECDAPAHIYRPGDNINPVFRFYRTKNANGPFRTRYQTVETLTGKTVGDKNVPVEFSTNARHIVQSCPYPLPADRQGLFKTILRLFEGEKEIGFSEFIHAVYKPLPVPNDFDDASLFAMDHVPYLGASRGNYELYFRLASEIGVRSYRDESRMDAEYPAAGRFFFAGAPGSIRSREGMFKTADKYRIRSMVCIGPETEGYLPGWIRTGKYSKTKYLYENNDPEKGKLLPQYQNSDRQTIDLKAFGEYCYRLAESYKGRVKYYEVFNERYGIAEYPDYWRTAYENIKRADPQAKVMPNIMRCEFTVTPSGIDDFNRDRFLKQGLASFCDAVSLHLYTYPVDNARPEENNPTFPDIYKAWKTLFKECGRPEIELLESEGGCRGPSYYRHVEPALYDKDTRRGQVIQTQRIIRKWIMFHDIGFTKLFYFKFFSGVDGFTDYCGLLEYDDTPKLTYIATGNAARLLTGSASLGRITFASDKIWGYQFKKRDGRRFVTVWNAVETPVELLLDIPAGEILVEDMLGNPVAPAERNKKTIIPIDGAPVYIFGVNEKSGIWADAGKVNNAFARAEIQGLIPVSLAIDLGRDPETGKPAVMALAKNTSGKTIDSVLRVAGIPAEWKPEGNRAGIVNLKPGETGAGYIDIGNLAPAKPPLRLNVFYDNAGQIVETGRTFFRVATIAKRSAPIAIDGRLDEEAWNKAGAGLRLTDKAQVVMEKEPETLRIRYNITDWQGAQNFSSVHKILWDEEALYIGARVCTPHFVQNRTNPERIYDSSCIELFVSADTAANAWDMEYKKSDYHVLLAPPTAENPGPLTYAVREKEKTFPLQEVEIAARPVEGGYEMEIKLPWKNFGFVKPMPAGTVLGFDIAVDSPFADGNRQWQMMWSGTDQNCADVSRFGRIALVDTVKETAPAGYKPVQPVEGVGMPAKVQCKEPGLHFVRWMYRTEPPAGQPVTLDFVQSQGPLRMDGGSPSLSPFYGYAPDWSIGCYYFYAPKAGEYSCQLSQYPSPSVGKLLVDGGSCGKAGKEDFEAGNLLSDGGFENGCADFTVSYPTWMQLKNGDIDATYALERNEFYNGRQALRMECRKGMAEMWSRPLPVLRGNNYRCSFWVRTDSNIPVEFWSDVRMEGGNPETRRVTSGFIASGNNIIANDRWQKVEYGFAVPQPWGNEPLAGSMQMRIKLMKPGIVLVDDIRVNMLKPAATTAKIGEHLLINDKSCKYALLGDKTGMLLVTEDTEDFVRGSGSLRMENKAATVQKEDVVGVPKKDALNNALFLNLVSEPFPLQGGKTYVLSFWARTDAVQLTVWNALESKNATTKISDPFYKGQAWPFEQAVDVGKEWKKYELAFSVPNGEDGNFRHLIRFTDKAILWMDDLRISGK